MCPRFLLLPLAAAALPKGGGRCAIDEDCHLNGRCLSGTCECDAAWTGPICGELHLLPPASADASRVAPAGLDVSGWGGGVLRLSDEDGNARWHLWASEFTNNCGLLSWQSNSLIRHSVSEVGPEGPFQQQDVTLGVFGHNPSAASMPNGSLLLYHIGQGEGSTVQNVECQAGVTLAKDGMLRAGPQNGTLLVADGPGGPWRAVDVPKFDNPSPWVFPNGSVLVMHVVRGGAPDPVTGCGRNQNGIAYAPTPEGPYMPLGGAPGDSLAVSIVKDQCNAEDPHIWQDHRGHWHALFHDMSKTLPPKYKYTNGKGGHAFSRDLFNWTYSSTLAYTGKVNHGDGSSASYGRRERPHLVFDPISRQPTHLLTSVCLDLLHPPMANCTWAKQFGCDVSFTHVQAINTKENQNFV